MGLGEVGPEPDRLAEFRDRLIELPLLSEDTAEVVVGNSVVRTDSDQCAEFADRFLQLTLSGQALARW